MTEFTALLMPVVGSGDSAAAMVTISVPMNENIVTSMPAMTAPNPLGMKPSGCHSESMPLTLESGMRPKIAAAPMPMNATIATTLIRANQNSNSP